MSHSFVKVKGKNLLSLLGELLKRLPDVLTLTTESGRCFGGCVGKGFGLRQRFEKGLSAFFADVIDGTAAGEHSNESCLGCGCWIKAVGRFPKIGKCFLDNIFSRGVILGVSSSDGPDKTTVFCHALFHGVFLSLGDLLEDPNLGFNHFLIAH